MSTNRLARTSFLTVLAGLVGAMALLVGPAQALESGGAFAEDDSVASGDAVAINGSVASGSSFAADDSTASGDSVAVGGSVASGCSTAVNDSTASGAPCEVTVHPIPDVDHDGDKGHKVDKDRDHRAAPVRATTARATTARRALAVTGSSTDTLAMAAGGMLFFGAVLVAASRRRSTI